MAENIVPLVGFNGVRSINLGNDHVAIVDQEDYDLLSQFSWRQCHSAGDSYYANAIVSMHRLIMDLRPGDGLVVDHRDGDGLNNRRGNLRVTTVAGNSKNRRPTRRGKTPYKGVKTFHEKLNLKRTFQAQIYVNGRNVSLGYFGTAEEAARAYDEAAIKHYGEFAWLNRPGD